MNSDDQKQNTVPFDPGFAPYVLVFSTTYEYMQTEIRKFKNATQRKMKYKVFEPGLMKLCDNLTAFYLGCMLYGGYIKNKYKDTPKEIDGNDFWGLDVENCRNSDVTIEVNALDKFIKTNDKNPFATRKINPKYADIVDNYIEFLELNNYFTNIKLTSDIKLPKAFKFIDKLAEKNIDKILETINDAISAKKIEKLLNSEYFEKI